MRWSKTGVSLHNEIVSFYKEQLIKNKGNLSLIDFSKSGILPPSFSGDSHVLLALVGGTQIIEIYISKFALNNNSFKLDLVYQLKDNYGVSEEDFLKADSYKGYYSGCRAGLTSFWILQKQRGFKPVTTVFQFSATVSGTFK